MVPIVIDVICVTRTVVAHAPFEYGAVLLVGKHIAYIAVLVRGLYACKASIRIFSLPVQSVAVMGIGSEIPNGQLGDGICIEEIFLTDSLVGGVPAYLSCYAVICIGFVFIVHIVVSYIRRFDELFSLFITSVCFIKRDVTPFPYLSSQPVVVNEICHIVSLRGK